MRKLVVAAVSVCALAVALAPAANASTSRSSRLSLTAKITSFRATAAGVVADGTLTGKLRSGTSVARDSAPVRFAVVAHRAGTRCNVLTLALAQLDLQLLGVEVKTSAIHLNVYAVPGRVLGDLFCALSHAKVTFPRSASVARALNSRLHGHSLQVFAASEPMASAAQGTGTVCQVLNLVLGPLHLDLLGLVVDLYGPNPQAPVVVTINADSSKGLLGQLLCGLAGGTGVNSLGGLQSLLSSLGLSLNTTQIQSLLNQLGISNLTAGLTQLDLNRILAALGLGSVTPSG